MESLFPVVTSLDYRTATSYSAFEFKEIHFFRVGSEILMFLGLLSKETSLYSRRKSRHAVKTVGSIRVTTFCKTNRVTKPLLPLLFISEYQS